MANQELPPLAEAEQAYRTLRRIVMSKVYRPPDDEWSGLVEGCRCLLVTIRYEYGEEGAALFERLNDE